MGLVKRQTVHLSSFFLRLMVHMHVFNEMEKEICNMYV